MIAYIILVGTSTLVIITMWLLSKTNTNFPTMDFKEITVGNLVTFLIVVFVPVLNGVVSFICVIINLIIIKDNIEYHWNSKLLSKKTQSIKSVMETKLFK